MSSPLVYLQRVNEADDLFVCWDCHAAVESVARVVPLWIFGKMSARVQDAWLCFACAERDLAEQES